MLSQFIGAYTKGTATHGTIKKAAGETPQWKHLYETKWSSLVKLRAIHQMLIPIFQPSVNKQRKIALISIWHVFARVCDFRCILIIFIHQKQW